jgi:Asp-tRNA(Asn)/Glu-tRNA(Gln) amidotransferase A subunit family amidase
MTAKRLFRTFQAVTILALSSLIPISGFSQGGPTRATTTFDLQTATVADINAAIDAGTLSSEKLVRLYLNRIEAYDKKGPKINSVITLNPKAVEEARALDAERKTKGRRSPLHGIPVVVKDLIDVQGLPTTACFKPFGAPVPERDAEIVRRLKTAGAIILAKVSCENWFGSDGFGKTHPIGATLNPYNVEYYTGGSSNGPGASIASWFATIGVGTDTGGSLQNPAAYNSLVGMLATQGSVSRAGIVPRSLTQDRAGALGRNVYDVAVTMGAMSGFDPEDLDTREGLGRYPQVKWADRLTTPNLSKFRIGVLREAMSTLPPNPEVQALFDSALEDMRKAGAQIVDPVLSGIDLARQSESSPIGVWPYEVILAGDVYLKRLGPNRPFKTMKDMINTVGPEKFVDSYVLALSYPPLEEDPGFMRRYRGRKAVRELIESLLAKYDLDAFVIQYGSAPPLAKTASGAAAPAGGRDSREIRGGGVVSSTGLPGIVMPAGYTKENLPVGIEFIGKSFDDLRLLQIAYGYEQATGKRHSPQITPPLPGEKIDH